MDAKQALKVVIDTLEFSVPEGEYDVCRSCGIADYEARFGIQPWKGKTGARGHREGCDVAQAIEALEKVI